MKVMIVDDEEAIGIILKKMFSKRHVEAVIATSYIESIGIIEKENFDLIVADRWLSGVDSTALVGELKRLNKKIPIIIMTGDSIAGKAENKFLSYIGKPFEFSELEKVINKMGIYLK
jgi:DNA-binding NtrC family response regulator